ncbi:MAG: AMMECR1 domain-containing protein, partial [Acidobacteria bacterium]|nr:AMMECR1 domain-containing protein [Acidobacteriota bacterium]
MQERGLHVEALYDIWDDFIYHMEDEEKPLANPSKWFPEFRWSARRAPEGLHPAQLARIVMSEYLASGELLRAPRMLDAVYDSSGGAWVSVRSRADIHLRHARDGFWHFPCEPCGTTAEDLLMASLRTAHELPAGREGQDALDESSIAVTFFDALESCTVGQLDNDRYGIVVRSLERPSWMGGALPRMPGIGNEWQQFQHARRKNAGLVSFEPFEIYRHEVFKAVEPGAGWQPTGVPLNGVRAWHEDKDICGPLAARALDLVLARVFGREETTRAVSAELLPCKLDSIYVTIYLDGHLRGCMGSVVRSLDEDIRTLACAALGDSRFEERGVDDPSRVAVSVSLLFSPLELGYFTPEEVIARVRHGQQTLMAYTGERVGLLLPFVASVYNLDPLSFAEAVLEKAGINEPPYSWCRFDCATWLADATGERLLVGGFPLSEDEGSPFDDLISRLATLHAGYLVRQQKEDGTLYSGYEPLQNRLREAHELPRLAHAAWVLTRAGGMLGGPELQVASERAVDYLLHTLSDGEAGCWLEADSHTPCVSEVSFLLLALLRLSPNDSRRAAVARLSKTLWDSIDAHGRIATHRPPAPSEDVYQDYFPGQALLALGVAGVAGATEVDEEKLSRAFRFYRQRFRHQRHFGQVSWMMQAFAQWWYATREPQFAEFVFEVGDWILEYQQEKTGAFINDHQPDTPGYTTALYLEGVAAAHKLAAELKDEERRRAYLSSFTRGLR